MNTIVKHTIAAALMAVACVASGESLYVVETTDFLGAKTFKAVTRAEAKDMELEIKRQNAMRVKVLAEIQADFAKNRDAHSDEKFYGSKIKPKTIRVMGPFAAEAAATKAAKMQEREDNKDLDDAKPGKGKKKKLSDSEKEKLFKEAQREIAIQNFAEEVEKQVADRLSGEAK